MIAFDGGRVKPVVGFLLRGMCRSFLPCVGGGAGVRYLRIPVTPYSIPWFDTVGSFDRWCSQGSPVAPGKGSMTMRLSRGVEVTDCSGLGWDFFPCVCWPVVTRPAAGPGPAQRAQVSALADEGLHWFHDDEYDRALESLTV